MTNEAGIPLAVVVDGANRHDVKLLVATVEVIVVTRPDPTDEQPQHLYPDAGYDYPDCADQAKAHQYVPHIRSRGQEKQLKATLPGFRSRRWVVERAHFRLNRSRRLLVRWEKKVENYLAFLHLACAQLIFQKVLVFG